jgi:hypothetical protein
MMIESSTTLDALDAMLCPPMTGPSRGFQAQIAK